MNRIGFVGAGNMARALGAGLKRSQPGATIMASDAVPQALERFRSETEGQAFPDNRSLVAASEIVILAVKPQTMPAVLAEIAGSVTPKHLVISIAAGITLKSIVEALGEKARLIRVMPNTPALVGQGMSVLVAGGAAMVRDLELAERLFSSVGRVARISDEALMDAVTAVSGSGPGFIFAFGEALIEAAVGAGLARDLADTLVKQTLLGSATLWQQSGQPASSLREMVSSPGGTTLAGLDALAKGSFAGAVRAAIDAATRRSRELSAV